LVKYLPAAQLRQNVKLVQVTQLAVLHCTATALTPSSKYPEIATHLLVAKFIYLK
jgi:hypothetical protein